LNYCEPGCRSLFEKAESLFTFWRATGLLGCRFFCGEINCGKVL